MTNGTIGVVGTDGITPVYQPEGRWCTWAKTEIYDGTVGNNRYVPKVKDYVIDPETYETWIVMSLDPVTLIPSLKSIRPANMSYSLIETDVLFGVGPGTQSDTYRVYLDRSVTPYVLAVDIRLRVNGSMASYAKIFKGSVLNDEGEVVSKVYNGSGILISENIPLELCSIEAATNINTKCVSVCNCTHNLEDGEIVTCVIYSDNGHVVSKRQLLVENTAFIRAANASIKYITGITCSSSFMSATDNNTISYPLNIPVNALNLMGTVHYSDGSTLTLPVDGNKFKMYGLDQYLSTIVGQQVDLVLAYAMSNTELAYAGVKTDNNYVTEPYKLITINPNNSYTVKLFGYPFWMGSEEGYRMNWYMFNLDRNIFFDVTPYVTFAVNTGGFNPKGYGYLQKKAVSINLRDVSGSFKAFVHTQVVDITLYGEPNVGDTVWTIAHESVNGKPPYGTGVYAKRVSSTSLDITFGTEVFSTWIDKVYNNIYPLVDKVNELQNIAPTHFVITYNTTSVEHSIEDWNNVLTMGVVVPIYSTITIRFIKKTASNEMNLGIAAMIVKPE